MAALSCSLALLLAVVAQAVSTGSLLGLLAVFAAYALGSSVVLILLSLGAAVARDALARHVRRLLPYINRLGGAALVLAGIYLLLYWVPALSGGQAGGIMGSVITAASVGLSGFITDTWPVITAMTVAAILAVLAFSRGRRNKAKAPDADPADGSDRSDAIDTHNSADSCCAPGTTEPLNDRNQQQGTP
ncbi:cytochrome C biosynthesis protein [Arthrobacter sp. HLT1-21]